MEDSYFGTADADRPQIGPEGEVYPPESAQGSNSQDAGSGADDGGTGSGTGSDGSGTSDSQEPERGVDTVEFADRFIAGFEGRASGALARFGTLPGRAYHTFVRSGSRPYYDNDANDYEAVDLTVLESAPVLAGVVALVVLGGRRTRQLLADDPLGRLWRGLQRPARQVDLLAVVMAVGLTTMYLPFLPLFSQITVRYLLPLAPLGVYGLARLSQVRDLVGNARQWLVGGFGVGVAVVGFTSLVTLRTLAVAVGEAMQFHALVNLALAAFVAIALGVHATGRPVDRRVRAVAFGAAMAGTSVFVAFTVLEFLRYGTFALPLVRLVADALSILT